MIKNILRKTHVLFTVWFAHMSAYRAAIVIHTLNGMAPLIMMAAWIGRAQASGGTLQGFTAQNFAAYFLAAWLTQQIIVSWVAWELDGQIRQGNLSPKLLKPIDPIWDHVVGHITEHLIRVPVIVITLVLGLMLVPGTRLSPDLSYVAWYALSVSLAFAARFLMAYCVGLLAFWFDQATALDEFYFLLAALLTGGFAPLEFYPPALRALIEWTPFPYLVYEPVQILLGNATDRDIVQIIGIQALWVVVFGLLRMILWRQGLRRYGAVGA